MFTILGEVLNSLDRFEETFPHDLGPSARGKQPNRNQFATMSTKRIAEDDNGQDGKGDTRRIEEEDDEVVGPLPSESSTRKKKKVIEFEHLYIRNLPSSEAYERSFMHRDLVTHVVVTPKTDFLISGSCDGHIKFWKKIPQGIEFVKH